MLTSIWSPGAYVIVLQRRLLGGAVSPSSLLCGLRNSAAAGLKPCLAAITGEPGLKAKGGIDKLAGTHCFKAASIEEKCLTHCWRWFMQAAWYFQYCANASAIMAALAAAQFLLR